MANQEFVSSINGINQWDEKMIKIIHGMACSGDSRLDLAVGYSKVV